MRVCLLVHGHYPAEPRTRRAAEALAGASNDVTVLALKSEGELESETVGAVRVHRVAPRARPGSANPVLRKVQTYASIRRIQREWLSLVSDLRFDVVHATNLDTLAVAQRIARQQGAKLVYDAHELWVEYVGDRGGRRAEAFLAVPTRVYWRMVERRLLDSADLVITVNQFIAGEMARRYGCGMPEVVLNVPVTPRPGAEPLPVELPGVRFIYQGVFSEGRGLLELVDAVAAVPEASLYLMGSGVLRGRLEARAVQPDVAGRVAVLDPVAPERVVPLARSADVGVIPFQPTTLNNYYASPNKLFEYMHAGLAILATDLPFIRATLEQTGAGLTVPAGGAPPLADGIRRLCLDRSLRERLAAAASAAAERYSWERESQRLLELYSRLVSA